MNQAKKPRLLECVRPVGTWNPNRSPDDEEFNYIDIGAIDQAQKTVSDIRTIRCADAPSRARQLVAAGDILVSTVRPNLNAVAKLGVEHDGATASTGFCVIRPDPAKLDGAYAFQWVKSPGFVTEMVALATGASYPAVSDRIVLGSCLPLPPLTEQRRIATILDQADTLRAQRGQALEELGRLVQALFVEMFGTLEAPILGANVAALEDIVAPGRIVTYGIVQAGPHVQDGVPYIKTGDIKDGRILVHQLARTSPAIAKDYSRSALRAGDIVMSIRATVGTTAMVAESLSGANLTQGTARISPGPGVDGIYLLNYLRTKSAQDWIQSQVKGATFREITLGRLRQMPVLLPNLDRQRAFARSIQAIESVVANHRAALSESDALFASLQHRAFAGAL